MANAKSIKRGDIVRYGGSLYSVLNAEPGALHLFNRLTKGRTLAVRPQECEYVGADTLTDPMDRGAVTQTTQTGTKTRTKYRWRCGDWVENTVLGLFGEVIENRNGKTKVEVSLHDGSHKLYWWPQEELTTAVGAYRTRNNYTPRGSEQAELDYQDSLGHQQDELSFRRDFGHDPFRRPAPEPKKKPDSGLGISTAGLIKNEVSKLEKESKSKMPRGLQKSTPTKRTESDSTFDGPSKPVPKRKGDW